jgi:hypothetical protein
MNGVGLLLWFIEWWKAGVVGKRRAGAHFYDLPANIRWLRRWCKPAVRSG